MKKLKLFHSSKEEYKVSPFLNYVLPEYIKENDEYIIVGDIYHSVYALKDYPLSTSSLGLLSEIGRMKDVNIHMYLSKCENSELDSILKNSIRKSKMLSSSNSITNRALGKELEDYTNIILDHICINRHYLIYTSVFIDVSSSSLDELNKLKDKVNFLLSTKNILYSKLMFRQLEGFLSCGYFSNNLFKNEFTRLLPDESLINLYPFSSHGKYDKCGYYIGQDDFSGEILDDTNEITDDKTNNNIIVLGNSGQGKSYLLKLLICNLLESGKRVLILDPENEYITLTNNLDGNNISFLSDSLSLNPLHIFFITDDKKYDYERHISYLLDFFSLLFDFSNKELSTLESFIHDLYIRFGIDKDTYYSKEQKFPTLYDLYKELKAKLDENNDTLDENRIFSNSIVRDLCLSIYQIACGNNKKYFLSEIEPNLDGRIINFSLKDVLSLSSQLKSAILFNILSYCENYLLTKGNTVLVIDELYLFLENKIALKSIRDNLKRVRKRNSSLILATQNINDLLLDDIKEYTKPILAIPQRKFLFSPGTVDSDKYMEMLDITPTEFSHIKDAKRGKCVYKCGLDTFIVNVQAPEYKNKLF